MVNRLEVVGILPHLRIGVALRDRECGMEDVLRMNRNINMAAPTSAMRRPFLGC
jgi:hypothetical protein